MANVDHQNHQNHQIWLFQLTRITTHPIGGVSCGHFLRSYGAGVYPTVDTSK
jgi:hypothetical protein